MHTLGVMKSGRDLLEALPQMMILQIGMASVTKQMVEMNYHLVTIHKTE